MCLIRYHPPTKHEVDILNNKLFMQIHDPKHLNNCDRETLCRVTLPLFSHFRTILHVTDTESRQV